MPKWFKKKYKPSRTPLTILDKHWSEIHRIGELRQIKWTIAGTLRFWILENIDEDFLTAKQQLTFERAIFVLRDSLSVAFPLVSSASTRLELHEVLDQIYSGFKASKSTKAAHMLQEEFEDGIFKQKRARKKGRPPQRDQTMGNILLVENMVNYIEKQSQNYVADDINSSMIRLESSFAQLLYSVRTIFSLPVCFEKRVRLLRLLDEIFFNIELQNQDQIKQGIDKFQKELMSKTVVQKFFGLLK